MDQEKKDKGIPDWSEIVSIMAISIISLFLSTSVFFQSLSDIREYIGDHNIVFSDLNYLAVAALMVFFYIIPRCVIGILNRIDPGRELWKREYAFNILSILSSLIFIAIVMIYVFPIFATTEGEERDYLWKIVIYWLVSIIILTFLLKLSVVKDLCAKVFNKICSLKKRLEN